MPHLYRLPRRQYTAPLTRVMPISLEDDMETLINSRDVILIGTALWAVIAARSVGGIVGAAVRVECL